MKMEFAESLGLCLFCEGASCEEQIVLLAVWDENHWSYDDCPVSIDANGHVTCVECGVNHGAPPNGGEVFDFEVAETIVRIRNAGLKVDKDRLAELEARMNVKVD